MILMLMSNDIDIDIDAGDLRLHLLKENIPMDVEPHHLRIPPSGHPECHQIIDDAMMKDG